MIYKKCVMTIDKNKATLDEDIYLYRLDKNIELYFTIVNNKYRFNKGDMNNIILITNASFFQVRLYKNAEIKYTFAIQPTDGGQAILTITDDLIDDPIEVGDYDFQISLLDEEKTSMISMPIVSKQLHVCEPLVSDDATMGKAILGLSKLATGEIKNAFDSEGNYIREIHQDGDILSASIINKFEEALDTNTKAIKNGTGTSYDDTEIKTDINTIKTELGTDTLTTTAQNIKGAVNEVAAQYKDIAKKIETGNIGNIIEPQDNDIPKVFFNGDKPTSKTSVYATIEYKSKSEHFKGYVDIKCQGTSSMAYPKKNYTIKMFTDSTMTNKLKKDFKDWGKQSKFCLKANYIDHSHARNICSAKLWSQIVGSRENYALLPELLRTSPCNGAIDGFPIKVYYNNNYEGIYTWNIPKDKWMFNMDDTLDNHCVLCGEEYNSGCFLSANASLWSDEIHDSMPASIVTSFNAFQNFVITSTDEQFKANLENYVYVDSLIDYYIFQYAICGLDSMGKNQLFATYDGTKWIATSYDMDSTFGLYWNGQNFVSSAYRMQEDYESVKNGAANKLYVRLEKLFVNEIKARYKQLRAEILSYSNIVNTFEPFMDIIGNDLYAEDLTIYTAIPSSSTNNIQQIRNYYRDRLVYVDTQINKLLAPGEQIHCTSIKLDQSALTLQPGNEPKNYLKDVPSAMNGSDLMFNEITIPVGFYKFTNVNGGTFQWLNYTLNDEGREEHQGVPDPAYINANSETNTLTVHGYPNNDANNTADKLALYKLTHTEVEGTEPITFTQAGTGYYDMDRGEIIASDNDVYSDTVELDSSKLYALKYIGEQPKTSGNLCLKANDGMIHKAGRTINKGNIAEIIRNKTSLSFSTNTSLSGALADYTLIEVTEDYEKDTTASARLNATVEPSNTTDSIVWSTSPVGIVSVVNGVIKGLSNGETVVTATCGTQKATCNVTVSGIS